MHYIEALQLTNLIVFTVLLATAAVMTREPTIRGWGVSISTWALNNIAFYISALWFANWFGVQTLNTWSSMTKLHGAVLVIGGMIIVSRKRKDGD